MFDSYIKRLHEERSAAWEQAKATLDTAEADKRDLSAEEDKTFRAANDAIVEKDAKIAELRAIAQREHDADEARSAAERFVRPAGDVVASDQAHDFRSDFEKLKNREIRSIDVRADKPLSMAEFRALSKLAAGAGGNTVSTSFYNQLVAHLIEVSGVMMTGPTVLTTAGGESIQIPKTTAHSAGTLTAEAAVIAASDPAFGLVTLGAFKYATLFQVSNELLDDSGVDLEGYLSMQAGRALGNSFGVHLITGSGAAQPSGAVTGATVGVTGGAGVTGAFTSDNLIDLYFSVIAPYRNSPSAAWLMKDSTLGTVRKLKDTTGQYLWQPSLQVGVPDTLLGKPVYTDPNVAAPALSAKSVIFGDWSQYFVRMVGGIRFERSDDFAFSSDLVTFRAILRGDGALVDLTGALKVFQGNAA